VNILVISPHYDDAPLSLGQSMLDGELSHHEVTVAIVFGRSNFTRWFTPTERRAPLATGIRRFEEFVNSRRFGYSTRIARHDESILRLKKSRAEDFLDIEIDPRSDPAFETVMGDMRQWANKADAVVVPLSVGDHIDHRVTTTVGADLLSEGVPVTFYEDRPYVNFSESPELEGLAASYATDLAPRPVSGPITKKKYEMTWYPSQLSQLFSDANTVDVTEGRVERLWAPADAPWPPIPSTST
jgi:hypothetical protein